MSTDGLALLVIGAVGAVVVWWGIRRAGTFQHDGQTYRRRRDGSFVDAAGVPVAGAAMVAALGTAYAAHRANQRASSGDGGSSDGDSSSSGWDWGSGGGDGGSDGGGDSGGGGDGGSD